MRGIRIFATGLLVAGTAAAAGVATPPAPPWYAVEVLVFRYTGPGAAQGESWPPRVGAPPLANALYPAPAATGAYAARPTASATFAQAQARLAAAGGYQTVAHLGWQQPGVGATAARPVSLAPLPVTAAGGATATAAFSETTPQSGAAAATTAPAATVRLDGTATLIVADKKPHIALDLRLCEPPPPGIRIQAPAAQSANAAAPASAAAAASAAAPASLAAPLGTAVRGQCFALRQRRQVTPGRLEYFDNPAFGALVLVAPLTPPGAGAGAPPAATAPGRSRAPGSP